MTILPFSVQNSFVLKDFKIFAIETENNAVNSYQMSWKVRIVLCHRLYFYAKLMLLSFDFTAETI
jgi:hypothetical protein